MACTLDKDFYQLPEGDQTIIGQKGIDLEYEVRLRINLARALYANPNILIVDDLFAHMEHDRRMKIFKSVFLDQFKFRTRILVCHHREVLEYADKVVCLSEGEIFATGTFD